MTSTLRAGPTPVSLFPTPDCTGAASSSYGAASSSSSAAADSGADDGGDSSGGTFQDALSRASSQSSSSQASSSQSSSNASDSSSASARRSAAKRAAARGRSASGKPTAKPASDDAGDDADDPAIDEGAADPTGATALASQTPPPAPAAGAKAIKPVVKRPRDETPGGANLPAQQARKPVDAPPKPATGATLRAATPGTASTAKTTDKGSTAPGAGNADGAADAKADPSQSSDSQSGSADPLSASAAQSSAGLAAITTPAFLTRLSTGAASGDAADAASTSGASAANANGSDDDSAGDLADLLGLDDSAPATGGRPASAPGAPASAPSAAGSSPSPFASILSAASAPSTPGAASGPAKATPADAPAPAPEARFASQNHTQIISGVRGDLLPGGGSMHLRLNPPALGDLQVSVSVRNGVMTADFRTSNDEATRLLSHSLGDLKSALESQGVSVDKLHVQQAPREKDASGGDADRDRRQPAAEQQQFDQREQQRKQMIQKMWDKLAGNDPVDVVA